MEPLDLSASQKCTIVLRCDVCHAEVKPLPTVLFFELTDPHELVKQSKRKCRTCGSVAYSMFIEPIEQEVQA